MNLKKTLRVVFGHAHRKIVCLIFVCLPCFACTLQAKAPMLFTKVSGTFTFILSIILIIVNLLIAYFLLQSKRLQTKNKNPAEINFQGRKTTYIHEGDNYYRAMMQSTKDGIIYCDTHRNIKYANPAFFSMTGLNEGFTAVDFQAKLHPTYNNYFIKKDNALLRDGFYECNISIEGSDGDYMTISTHSVEVKTESGEVEGSLTVFRDITSINREMEEVLKNKIEYDKENKLKAGFLAFISHEIRTPLNGVVGFANLLLEDHLSKKDRQEYVEHINYNSEKLLQIIGDIIDLSRLSSSQLEMTYEAASLSELVQAAAKDAKVVIKRTDKPIILIVRNHFAGANDTAVIDRKWLKRVLDHLLDNAIKFTLNGTIDLIYTVEDEMICFTVKDTGIGIDKENLSRIFEEFRQEFTGHQRPFEGLGIGLTLAKEVIERMGGRIAVKSEKEIGSEFMFCIPYRLAEKKSDSNTPPIIENQLPQAISWSNKKCLLVDDNKDTLIYLKRILVDTGINILTAHSGIEAIKFVMSDSTIDIVLLDTQMPEMNGFEAVKMIKELRSNLPIVATAFAFEDDIDIILEAGCDVCLTKPIRRDNLITVMSGFIKSD